MLSLNEATMFYNNDVGVLFANNYIARFRGIGYF